MARTTDPPTGLEAVIREIADLRRIVTREASRQRAVVLPVVSGAGKTTVTDADFETPVGDGVLALVTNTSDSTTRLAVRAGGTWKTTSALS